MRGGGEATLGEVQAAEAIRSGAEISVLRQLRDGHALRPKGFPVSLALIGMRDGKDYKIPISERTRFETMTTPGGRQVIVIRA
jgi:hypothetical protein